ncbi:S8 family serine peptidase [Spongiactinospora gelatinilytica]|uniref:S8 family serine peptidase n=1 Tax=Spongiactinospora gelatinilytica TaxID=2666298 RepID=UPI001F1CF605|nr:S8 family serine peptidase [Spongiactinospora gelatinilytica]
MVATVDTGVQFDHPALAASYRGKNANGTLTHDHNWFDAINNCPDTAVPCDRTGHGTHVTGTMTGANGIGVAPGTPSVVPPLTVPPPSAAAGVPVARATPDTAAARASEMRVMHEFLPSEWMDRAVAMISSGEPPWPAAKAPDTAGGRARTRFTACSRAPRGVRQPYCPSAD